MHFLSPLPSPPSLLPAGAAASFIPRHWSEVPFAETTATHVPPSRLRFLPDWPAPSTPSPPPAARPLSAPPLPLPSPPVVSRRTPETATIAEDADVDYTDDDLLQALAPLIHGAVHANEARITQDLEPLLRTTIRRSLAEYAPGRRPFLPPRLLDRIAWHFKALVTSRTYEEILFEKTHRFQVDEVFAFDANTLALISHASCDPARHASVSRVTTTAMRIAAIARDDHGILTRTFELPDKRLAVSREGRFIVLIALVRGKPSEILFDDLAHTLSRIEKKFQDRFRANGSPLLHALQPYLEDCLLIQSPSSAT